jgi:branched-chain amino acid transport system permease protein
LVNWTGDLSLAHAQLIGVSALSVGVLSKSWHVSPIYLIPLGAAIGFVAGAIVGLPALRARGVQVALITLAAGVAIDRFLFSQSWFSLGFGPVPTPEIGPWSFHSSRELFPVCALLAAVATILAWILFRSRTTRAWYWVRDDPSSAAAYGIFVNGYRTFAYAVAGSFAGLAGGLFAIWVQSFTPESFTSTQSFTYLLIVVIAGPGFLTGVLMSAGGFEAGTLFLSGGTVISYLGPILLIFNVTRYPGGINGINREMLERYHSWRTQRSPLESR